MNQGSQFVDQPSSEGSDVSVPLGGREIKMPLFRSDGGDLDRFRSILTAVGERISDLDASTLSRHWAHVGHLSPRGVAPIVCIQRDWPGRVLPVPASWLPETWQASDRFRTGNPIAQDSSNRPIDGHDRVLPYECSHRGALVRFASWLVDDAPEQDLSWQIAGWLAATHNEAVGDEDAARRFEQRWDEGEWQMSSHGRRCWEVLEGKLCGDRDALRRTVEWLFATECFLNLAYRWAGRRFEE